MSGVRVARGCRVGAVLRKSEVSESCTVGLPGVRETVSRADRAMSELSPVCRSVV